MFWPFKKKKRPLATEVTPPPHDDVIGGYWGNKIEWMTCDNDKEVWRIVGWKPLNQYPKVGNIILAEMQRSWIWFKITKIDPCRDPSDMFFADMKPVAQKMKETA